MTRDRVRPPSTADKQQFAVAGIIASAVLAVNVVVNYQHKLAEFLVDLASESGSPANPENKFE